MNFKATIDHFEDEEAFLRTIDGDMIAWPKDKLPKDAYNGMILNVNILSEKETEDDKKKLAKEILNEMLNVGEDETNN